MASQQSSARQTSQSTDRQPIDRPTFFTYFPAQSQAGEAAARSLSVTEMQASEASSPLRQPRFFTYQVPERILQDRATGGRRTRSPPPGSEHSEHDDDNSERPRFFTYYPEPPATRREARNEERPPRYLFTYQVPACAGTFSHGAASAPPPPSYETSETQYSGRASRNVPVA